MPQRARHAGSRGRRTKTLEIDPAARHVDPVGVIETSVREVPRQIFRDGRDRARPARSEPRDPAPALELPSLGPVLAVDRPHERKARVPEHAVRLEIDPVRHVRVDEVGSKAPQPARQPRTET